MKQFTCILIVFAIIMVANVSSMGIVISEDFASAALKIDSDLAEILAENDDPVKKFPVAIELVDTIDSSEIESRALTTAGVTLSEIESNDFTVRIFKDGIQVASSGAPSNTPSENSPSVTGRTNYEVVEIPVSVLQTYGAGYYQVKIYTSGSFLGSVPATLGVAWEQNW